MNGSRIEPNPILNPLQSLPLLPGIIPRPQKKNILQRLPNNLFRLLLPSHELLRNLIQRLNLRHIILEHGIDGVGEEDYCSADAAGLGVDEEVECDGGFADDLEFLEEAEDCF